MTVKTKNSEYKIDREQSLIWGGALGGSAVSFTTIQLRAGDPMRVTLADGRRMTTSPVTLIRYFS